MKRRYFLKSAAAAAATTAAAASSFPAPAIAQGMRELKFVTSWPKNLPGPGVAAMRIKRRIETLSEGKLSVKIFHAGELVPAFGVFDAVAKGTADMHHSGAAFNMGKSPAYGVIFNVPFGLSSVEVRAWMQYGGGRELYDELGAQFGHKHFMAGQPGAGMFGWIKKDLKSLDDLKGLKYRLPGLGGEVLRKLGVTIITMPPAELLPSIQSGALDGAEWIGAFHDLALGFYKVVKNYYYPGFHEPSPSTELSLNLDVWNSLSKNHQEMFNVIAEAENDTWIAESIFLNTQALETLVNKHGVKLRHLPDDIIKAIAEKTDEVVAEQRVKDPLTKKIYDSYSNWRRQVIPYSEITQKAFYNNRHLVTY